MRIILTFVLTMALSIGYAQHTDAMLFGDVKDAKTGEHIPYANVVVKGTSIGTTTDATGHYKLTNLPLGTVTVTVSSLGYRTLEQKVVMSKNKGSELYFSLKQDAIMTDQVVVSASRNKISRDAAPVIVSALSPMQIEAIEANTVADALDFTPGLRVEANCQNCGFTQLRMNGLEGAYSQILVNSRPVFSGLAGVYGLEQIPTEMVERVEVVRGGGSALFGSNAIGGTVNIITKDPYRNMFHVGIKGAAIGVGTDEVASSKETDFNGAIISDDKKAGLFVFGMHKDRDAWDANDDGFTEMVKLKNTSTGFQTYYKPTDRSKISLEYHNLTEFRRGGNKLDLLPHNTDITEQLRHNNNSAGVSYDLITNKESNDKLSVFVSGRHVDRDSYYGAEQAPEAYGHTLGLTTVAGAQYTKNFKSVLSAPGVLTVGIENINDGIEDTKLGETGKNNTTVADQSVNTIGVFAQYQMNFSVVKILLGGRMDSYNIKNDGEKVLNPHNSGTALNPRANILYDLTENIQLRGTYSTGFRAPQIFDEDLHIEASGARRVIHENAEDLDIEKSQSISGSVRYKNDFGNWQTEFLVEGFYTSIDNPFVMDLGDIDPITREVVSTRSNGDKATIMGANFEFTAAPSREFYVQLGGTVQSSLYDKEQGWGEEDEHVSKEMLRTPGSYGYLILNYEAIDELNISLSANYTGMMYVPHMAGGNDKDGNLITEESLVETESFIVLNLKASYCLDFGKQNSLEFSAGIKNILNSYQSDYDYGVGRDAGYIYGPRRPRTIFAGVKFSM